MRPVRRPWYALAALWTFALPFGVQQLASYYYLADNVNAFFTVSGWRLPLFIVSVLTGSILGGVISRDIWKGGLSAVAGLLTFFLTAYVLCDPRVCYSSGIDGLEPLIFGFFLSSVAMSGAALGAAIRQAPQSPRSQAASTFFGFASLGFYPVVFTFAGTKILSPLHPWGAAAILGAGALSLAASVALVLSPRSGFALIVGSLGTLCALSAGIALAYLPTIAGPVAAIILGTVIAAAAGAGWARANRSSVQRRRRWLSGMFATTLVLVLLLMLLAVPDAVNGVIPTDGATSPYAIGVPVYVGAFMNATAGHANGAGVEVTFAGTNASSIQPDNFLSAGIGIHAAGCCVDGIDYSYRFDLYLFHDGNESLVASAWEVCDDNAACGGHSWKVLIFQKSQPLLSPELGGDVHLRMEWVQGPSGPHVLWEVSWAHTLPPGAFVNFTEFSPPKAENPNFNTGVLPGGTLGPAQSGSYFFQFGVMSSYPIDHGGWAVQLNCPEVLTEAWACVSHAETLAGDQSYWKVFWRWGEDYPNVSVTSEGGQGIGFAYSSTSAQSFDRLW